MRIIRKLLEFLGFFPAVFSNNIKNIWWYLKDYRQVKKWDKQEFALAKPFPILNERNVASGRLSGHYFHQDLWVAQDIFKENPSKHVDVGSRTDGFVTHVASFREIEVLDIRKAEDKIQNIIFKQTDFMQELSEGLKEYTESLSCLHVIEHFGLGRYGDTLDEEGHQRGWQNLYEILKPGGLFYFSTPIGPQRIEFNAHRVFSLSFLDQWITEKYEILKFSFIDDKGDFHEDVSFNEEIKSTNAGCWFGCGVFKLRKLPTAH